MHNRLLFVFCNIRGVHYLFNADLMLDLAAFYYGAFILNYPIKQQNAFTGRRYSICPTLLRVHTFLCLAAVLAGRLATRPVGW